jgi:hypothetical protein
MGPPSPSGEPKPDLLRSIAADKAVVGETFVVGAGAGRAIARDPLRGACKTPRVYRYPACEAAPIKDRRSTGLLGLLHHKYGTLGVFDHALGSAS